MDLLFRHPHPAENHNQYPPSTTEITRNPTPAKAVLSPGERSSINPINPINPMEGNPSPVAQKISGGKGRRKLSGRNKSPGGRRGGNQKSITQGGPLLDTTDNVYNLGTKAEGKSRIMDWSNSLLFYNIKNGISSFNHMKDTNIYYEFEIEYIINMFTFRHKDLKRTDLVKPFFVKTKHTLQKLCVELLLSNVFAEIDAKITKVYNIYIIYII